MPAQPQKAQFVSTNTYIDVIGSRNLARQIFSLGPFSASQSDLQIGDGCLFTVASTLGINITGMFSGGVPGRDVELLNIGTFAITLTHEDASSKPMNRFFSSTAANVAIQPNDFISFFYDTTIFRWRIRPLASGGGPPPLGPQSPPATFAWNAALSGTINGVNAVFTLPSTPKSPGTSLMLFKNGVLQRAGLDFTLSAGTTVTFVAGAIPQVGDQLIASYQLT